MGDFFYYGQKDVIRRLNELAGRGAVVASYAPAVGRSPLGGPNGYMSPAWLDPNLPIQTKRLQAVDLLGVGDGSIATSFLSPGGIGLAAGQERDSLRLGVGVTGGVTYPGCFSWFTSAGNGNPFKEGYRLSLKAFDTGSNAWSPDLLIVRGSGDVYMPRLKAGSSDPSAFHNISRGTGQGAEVLMIGVDNAPAPSVGILASDGAGGWGPTPSVLYAGKNSVTGRSVSAAGTVNTSGNDYAEYIFKSPICGIVAPGQIVGITADNKVTDKWADTVMFSIKSTAPSFVGGDSWASDIGQRPSPQAGPAPSQPLRREDVVAQQPVPGTNPPEYEDVVTESGETDDEWAEKQAAYTAALATHNVAVQQDAEVMAAFDAALEAARQKVDRIAIAGRVPVNVQGAQPGDYIVPVQDGTGIKGIAVHEDDLSMKQYFRAVGRVISIEPDGRAYVMAKVV